MTRRALVVVAVLLAACGDSGIGGAGTGGEEIGGGEVGGSTSNMMSDGGGGFGVGGDGGDGGNGGTPLTGGMGGDGGQPEGGGGAACMPTAEVCDGVDNDCNNSVDEGFEATGSELTGEPFASMDHPVALSNGSTFAVVHRGAPTELRLLNAQGQQTAAVEVDAGQAQDYDIAWNGSEWGVAWVKPLSQGTVFRTYSAAGAPTSDVVMVDVGGDWRVDVVADGPDFIVASEQRIARVSGGDVVDVVLAKAEHIVAVAGGWLIFDAQTVAPLSADLDVGTWSVLPTISSIFDVVSHESGAVLVATTPVAVRAVEIDATGTPTGNEWESLSFDYAAIVPGPLVLKGGKITRLGSNLEEQGSFDVLSQPVGYPLALARSATSTIAIVDTGSSVGRVMGDAICDVP